jgi:hypothetical protein
VSHWFQCWRFSEIQEGSTRCYSLSQFGIGQSGEGLSWHWQRGEPLAWGLREWLIHFLVSTKAECEAQDHILDLTPLTDWLDKVAYTTYLNFAHFVTFLR